MHANVYNCRLRTMTGFLIKDQNPEPTLINSISDASGCRATVKYVFRMVSMDGSHFQNALQMVKKKQKCPALMVHLANHNIY